ncbi:MAG TPA: DUF938 domain-containing protein [Rhodopseudomonas sp.]|uniref:DUF938 domain-containing protein n=1 Tax=Rhodopseudomonas sp. TaxID=1078 RepID=UPI002EDB6157
MPQIPVEFGQQPRRDSDGRLDAAAFHRNHAAIWAALAPLLDAPSGEVLEAGSGTGQHVVAFARQSPNLIWWPSDFNPAHRASIAAWRAEARLANVRPPLFIDLSDPAWCPRMQDGSGPGPLLAVFCANVVHIAPWCVAEGLFAGAARILRDDGRLILYGPFKRDGVATAPSNAAFDQSLRASNPDWGLRDLDELETLGRGHGLILSNITEMPANNLLLAWSRG